MTDRPSPFRHGIWTVLVFASMLVVTAGVEFAMGRPPLGADGRFGLWEGDIWSAGQSQRLADPYSFTHVVHGMLFYALLRLAAPKLGADRRFLTAAFLEAAWEVLENSPFIIERYRAATIALGYQGDSVLNSLSDVLMMALGFWLALELKVRWSVGVALALELGMLLWVRDNLALNILMLICPIDAIKSWQMAGAPGR